MANEAIRLLAPDYFANEKAEVYAQAEEWAQRSYAVGVAVHDGETRGLREAYIRQLNSYNVLADMIKNLEVDPDCDCKTCRALKKARAIVEA